MCEKDPEKKKDEEEMLKEAEEFSGSDKDFVVDEDGRKEVKTGGLIKEGVV